MWTFLANPLQETVRTNVIQHKILNNTYLHRFLCSKVESYHSMYVHKYYIQIVYTIVKRKINDISKGCLVTL